MAKCIRRLTIIIGCLATLTVSSPAQATDDAARGEDKFAAAVQAATREVAPCVLRIETFGGLEKIGQMLVGTGPTTGVAVSEDGYVISSSFNFIQQPSSILVTMPSGKRVSAQIVARDHSRMLVLLKVSSDEKLRVPKSIKRDALRVGQSTIALGRTLSKGEPNISLGILSAKNRIWGKAIQTDAKISPANYGGPLIDLAGNVLGILVPLSPQSTGEVAGAEWYDSGIGFAVPLDEILVRFDTLKQGHDLHPGQLGVSLKENAMYTGPVEVAACQVNSPAAKAGLKKGDRIIEISGEPIKWQAHLRHALGPRYAGDKIHIVALRGKDRIEGHVELAKEIEPFDVPFLGILPRRDSKEMATIRFIYPQSPAANAGLQTGDRLTKFAGQEIKNADTLREMVGTHDRRAAPEVEITLIREGKTLTKKTGFASLPQEIPAALPVDDSAPDLPKPEIATGEIEIKLPEERNACFAYVPSTYRQQIPHGLVVWLPSPGKVNRNDLIKRWNSLCEKHNLILLAPQAAKPDQWDPTEADFVRKAIDDVTARYNVDRNRIVVHGYQAGGTLGYLVAFANEDLVRGVATIDAGLPTRITPPAADPMQRMAYYLAAAKGTSAEDANEKAAKQLRKMKLPVIIHSLGEKPRYLSDDELSELARWIDSLDRI